MRSAQTFGGWASEAATPDEVTAGNGQPRTPKAAALRTTKWTVGRASRSMTTPAGVSALGCERAPKRCVVDLEPARRLLQVPPTADSTLERAQSRAQRWYGDSRAGFWVQESLLAAIGGKNRSRARPKAGTAPRSAQFWRQTAAFGGLHVQILLPWPQQVAVERFSASLGTVTS